MAASETVMSRKHDKSLLNISGKSNVLNTFMEDINDSFIAEPCGNKQEEDRSFFMSPTVVNLERFIDEKSEEVKKNQLNKEIVKAITSELKQNDVFEHSQRFVKHLEEEVLFLRKELVEKNVVIKTLLNDINSLTSALPTNSVTIATQQNLSKKSETSFIKNKTDNETNEFYDHNDKHVETLNDLKERSLADDFSKQNTVKDNVTLRKKQKAVKSPIKEVNQKRKITIVGDSIIKGLNKGGFKTDDVTVRCHPGATTEDIVDHANPVLRNKPDVMIVHAGTNDITKHIDTCKYLDKLIQMVKKKHPNTKIVLSSAITRHDKNLNTEVVKMNEKLKTITESHGIHLIKHDNISEKALSTDKLHLNKGGSSQLARNFMDFLTQY